VCLTGNQTLLFYFCSDCSRSFSSSSQSFSRLQCPVSSLKWQHQHPGSGGAGSSTTTGSGSTGFFFGTILSHPGQATIVYRRHRERSGLLLHNSDNLPVLEERQLSNTRLHSGAVDVSTFFGMLFLALQSQPKNAVNCYQRQTHI